MPIRKTPAKRRAEFEEEKRKRDEKAKREAEAQAEARAFAKSEIERKAKISADVTAQQRTPKGELSLADRQELSDARARQAGIQPRLIPEVIGTGVFSQRQLQERGGIAGTGVTRDGGTATGQPFLSIQEENARIEALRQQGVFEETTIKETDLTDPFGAGKLETIPIVRDLPFIQPAGIGLRNAFVLASDSVEGKFALFNQEELNNLDNLTVRDLALLQIRRNSFNEGISAGERFGSTVEAIPVLGSLSAKYAGGLTESPSANAENVIAEIRSERQRASTTTEKVKNGLVSGADGFAMALQMEENIATLEGRLQLLILTSPILQANTDEVLKIQQEIVRSKERIAQLKTASAIVLTGEATGTGRIIPTDEQIFIELKNIANTPTS